jgi:hypothetical protein
MKHSGAAAAAFGRRSTSLTAWSASARGYDGGRVVEALVGATVAVLVAFTVVSGGPFLRLLYVLVGVVVAWMLSAEAFLACALLLLSISSVLDRHAIAVGGATFYTTDILVILALVRSARPIERVAPTRPFRGTLGICLTAWCGVMLVAGLRGASAGESPVTIIRYETALIYFPLLYVAFSRLLREKELKLANLWKLLAFVAVGLVAWMFVMRILNAPFEGNTGFSELGRVTTSEGSTVRRDFGAASAFIVYPALALAAIAAMVYAPRRRGAAALLAFIGVVATFVTLIRGEIFGLVLGAVAIFLLHSRTSGRTSRVRSAVTLTAGCAAMLLLVAYINPNVRDAIVERSLPGVFSQSKIASENAEYRAKALRLGITVADRHPGGIGFRNDAVLERSNIDPEYLGHSGPAWLLVFTGWPGLIASALALLALMARSFRVPAATSWLHAFFVGFVLLMIGYSFGADGFVGQAWVIMLFALVIALRFGLPEPRK